MGAQATLISRSLVELCQHGRPLSRKGAKMENHFELPYYDRADAHYQVGRRPRTLRITINPDDKPWFLDPDPEMLEVMVQRFSRLGN